MNGKQCCRSERSVPLPNFVPPLFQVRHDLGLQSLPLIPGPAALAQAKVKSIVIPKSRLGGWSLDYVCERKHFGTVIEIEAIRVHISKANRSNCSTCSAPWPTQTLATSSWRLSTTHADLHTRRRRRFTLLSCGNRFFERSSMHWPRKQKHALAKKEKRDRTYLKMPAELRKGKK
eukprot:COSAG01_NODE_140_length_24259_cov_41.225096_1_plen_175_part_00